MKQGKMNNELNYRWSPTKHDPLSIIYLIQIGELILFILPPMSPITYVFLIFIALGIVLENLNISNLKKYGLMFILMILSVYMMVTVTISPFFKNNDNLPIESEKRLYNSSFLASREILYIGNFEIITVESKVDMMNEFTINVLLEEQRISETIPLNSLTEIDTAYGMKKYVYRNENKIVISDKKQSDDFYKEFN